MYLGDHEKDALILHQPSHYTQFDRYPHLFLKAAELNQVGKPKILSFGCATGEEVASLLKYFPKSQIIGAEIDPLLVKTCQDRHPHPHLKFIHSRDEELKRHGPFDLIFALNVFVRAVTNMDAFPPYLFQYFEDEMMRLDALLNPGGFFVLWHTQHDFTVTEIYKSKNYKAHIFPEFKRNFYQKASSVTDSF